MDSLILLQESGFPTQFQTLPASPAEMHLPSASAAAARQWLTRGRGRHTPSRRVFSWEELPWSHPEHCRLQAGNSRPQNLLSWGSNRSEARRNVSALSPQMPGLIR